MVLSTDTVLLGFIAADLGFSQYIDNSNNLPTSLENTPLSQIIETFTVYLYSNSAVSNDYISLNNNFTSITYNSTLPITIEIPYISGNLEIFYNTVIITIPEIFYNENTFRKVVFTTTVETTSYCLNYLVSIDPGNSGYGGFPLSLIFPTSASSILESTYNIFTLTGGIGDYNSSTLNPFTNLNAPVNAGIVGGSQMYKQFSNNSYNTSNSGWLNIDITYNPPVVVTNQLKNSSVILFGGYIASDFYITYPDPDKETNTTISSTNPPYTLGGGATDFQYGTDYGYSNLNLYLTNGNQTTTSNASGGVSNMGFSYTVLEVQTNSNPPEYTYTITISFPKIIYEVSEGVFSNIINLSFTYTEKNQAANTYASYINTYSGLFANYNEGTQPPVFLSSSYGGTSTDPQYASGYFSLQAGIGTMPTFYNNLKYCNTNPFTFGTSTLGGYYGDIYLGASASANNSLWVVVWKT